MADPMITTVIPTYQRPGLLCRTIRSVLDQTYPHFRLCVYDNASGDETGELVAALASQDARIRYHRHRENIGAQNNFIYGCSRAQTPFVHLISDDDFLLPGFFAQAVAALKENSAAAFFSGGMLSAEASGQVRGFLRYGSGPGKAYRPPQLFHMLAPYTRTWTSALFRRSSLERLGGIKKETGYSFSLDLLLRIAAQCEGILSDTPCAVFMVHPGSSSVAEAAEAFESQLDLAYFRSISEAIGDAFDRKIISDDDAAEMRNLLSSVTQRVFFQGALALLARGHHLASTVRTSEILADHFKQPRLAALIRATALKNRFGSLLRFGLRNTKLARNAWFARSRRGQYADYSGLVKARMRQLAN